MANFVFQKSFSAGELSPALYARVDLEKYASGAALLRNFIGDYKGGAASRPGTQFIGPCKDIPGEPRLIPFVVSTLAAYVLEFGDFYIRFVANGAYILDVGTGLPVELSSPYAVGDLPLLKYVQSANVLTLTHQSYPVYNLMRLTSTSFLLAQDIIGPVVASPAAPTITQQNSADVKSRYGYVVTAVDASGEESLPSDINVVDGSILNQNTGICNSISWPTVAEAVGYRVYKVGPVASGSGGTTASPLPTVYGYIGASVTTSFIDNNIAADYSQTPPQFQDPFSPGQIASVGVTTPGSTYTGAIRQLIFTGDGTDAAGYIIINSATGTVVGAVITNPGKNYTTVTVSDNGANNASYSVDLGQQSGTYPACVSYFQQRRTFGGTANFPEALVMSVPGQYDNFDVHPIVQDSDAITISIASRQVNAIKSLTAMPTGLIVLTTGGGFLVSGGSAEAAVTPSTVVAFPQASPGCNDLPPLVVNSSILYNQNRGAVVRDLVFNFYVQAYTGTDRSVLAAHLFTNHTLTQWTYAEEPFRLVQAIRSDGVLLNFTYVPEQEIFGWTHSDTNGFFRSIAAIPEGNENAVYVIVQRLVDGNWVYYTERFASRLFNTIEGTWCLDSGLSTLAVTPPANIALSAATGTGVLVTADANVFSGTDVGSTLWANHGKATVTIFHSPTSISVDILRDFDVVLDDPLFTPVPIAMNDWMLNPNVTTLSGLDHLEGLSVGAVADGMVIEDQIVTAGTITIPVASSIIVAGLRYRCQLQTLKLDVGDPTIQGKRKIITGITARVYQTAGISVGPDFAHLTVMKDFISSFPPTLFSNDGRTLISGSWNTNGQVCFQQDLPLPVTILGVIPEVTLGDTMR